MSVLAHDTLPDTKHSAVNQYVRPYVNCQNSQFHLCSAFLLLTTFGTPPQGLPTPLVYFPSLKRSYSHVSDSRMSEDISGLKNLTKLCKVTLACSTSTIRCTAFVVLLRHNLTLLGASLNRLGLQHIRRLFSLGDVSTTPHPHSDSSASVDEVRQCGVSCASLAQVEQEAPFSHKCEIIPLALNADLIPFFVACFLPLPPCPATVNNTQSPACTIGHSARRREGDPQ
jgi:hypothetical protein